jgi:hypothetical protein
MLFFVAKPKTIFPLNLNLNLQSFSFYNGLSYKGKSLKDNTKIRIKQRLRFCLTSICVSRSNSVILSAYYNMLA